MQAFARRAVRHRWSVIGGWIVLVVVLTALSRLTGGANYREDFSFAGYDSQSARALLDRSFPRAAGDSDQIVVHVTSGRVTDSDVRNRIQPMLSHVSRLPHIVTVVDPYTSGGPTISKDRTTAFATITFDKRANDLPEAAIDTVIDTARAERTSTVQIELGGQAIEQTESSGPGQATIVGLAVAVLVLLALFGSAIAMLMPILTALIAIGAGIGVNALVSHAMALNSSTEAIALMIALGVGVDYSLFIVSRFRGLLADGHDPKTAAAESVNTSGRAVLFAGSLVVLALLGMLLLGVSITDGIAVSAAIEVAFTMAAALTLLPAVLSLLGRRINSMRVPGRHPAGSAPTSARLGTWIDLLRRARWVFAAGVIVVLVVLALPLLTMRLGSSDAGSDPPGSTTRRAYDLLAKGFGPGFNGPLVLAATPSDPAVLRHLADSIENDPAVGSVSPPRSNSDHTAAVLQVYPTTSPQSAETSDLVHRLRDTVIPRATADTGMVIHVGGPTATFIDLSALLSSRLVPFIAVVVAIGFVVLLLVFRSLAIPITAAVLNLLSIGAALGIVVAVFQYGWTGLATGPVQFALPVMTFAIVFGLSTDYQVFLLTRIQEAWHSHHDNGRAVRESMGRVSGVITGAAVIMIAVFGSFVLGGQRLLQEIGTGLAVAVALDAFLIRFILVPATMFILGDRNWWLPCWLHWLPRTHIEPNNPAARPEPVETGQARDGELIRSATRRSTRPTRYSKRTSIPP